MASFVVAGLVVTGLTVMGRMTGGIRYLLLALLTLGIASCHGVETQQERQVASNFKVAAIFPHKTNNDEAHSQDGLAGLELIEKQLIAKTAYTSEVNNLPADQVKNIFSQYAEQGFDFVVGNGDFVTTVAAIAKTFPRTKFAVTDVYSGNNGNLGSLSFRNGELGYLCGVVAAIKSNTNRISFIGSTDSASNQEIATLFERGARAIKPNITVSVNWIGNDTNATRAEAIAVAQISAGSDVLLVNAGQAGLPVHTLANTKQIYTIGWGTDQANQAPGTVLTSGIQRLPELLLQGARLVRLGRWEGKQYRFGLREGVQDLAPFRGTLTPAEEAIVQQTKDDILTGKVDVSL